GIASDNSTIIFSGTSQATPHVTGMITLIIATSGNLPPDQMSAAIDKLATPDVVTGNIQGSPNKFVRVPFCTQSQKGPKETHSPKSPKDKKYHH
ncbi:32612_t:CDS:2, partial [Racocetra persica]